MSLSVVGLAADDSRRQAEVDRLMPRLHDDQMVEIDGIESAYQSAVSWVNSAISESRRRLAETDQESEHVGSAGTELIEKV